MNKDTQGDECLNCKGGFVVCMPNSECDMRVTNYKTLHFAEKTNEVTSFSERIKDSLPVET